MKYLISLLLISFSSFAIAQVTELANLGDSKNSRYFGKVGQKMLFQKDNSKLWETNGTKEGTIDLNISSFMTNYFQISDDSLLITTSESNYGQFEPTTVVYLYTTSMDAPTPITEIFDFFGTDRIKQTGDMIVILGIDKFAFYKISTNQISTKSFPEVSASSFINWTLFNNKVIISKKKTLYSIDLDNFTLSVIADFPNFLSKLFHSPKNNELLIILNNKLWSIDKNDSISLVKDFNPYYATSSTNFTSFTVNIGEYTIWAALGHDSSNVTHTYYVGTDGTSANTDTLVTFLGSSAYINLQSSKFIEANGKAYFVGMDQIWETNGTKNATKPVETQPSIKIIHIQNLINPKGFLVLANSNIGYPSQFYFNGQPELISLESDNPNKNITFYQIKAYSSDNNIYLNMLDLNYGIELHQFNPASKTTKIIQDANSYAKWSFPHEVGHLSNQLFFTVQKEDNQYYLYKVDETQLIPDLPTVNRNYEWAENIFSILGDVNFDYSTMDAQENLIVAAKTSPKRRFGLLYNRKTVGDTSSSTSILKFDKEGQLVWARNIPDATTSHHSTIINTDAENNIVVGFYILHDVTFQNQPLFESNGRMVLAKFSPQGDIKWIKQAKIGIGGDIQTIEVDDNNQIIVAGKYSGSQALFDNISTQGERNKTTFLAKYNQEGSCLWVHSFPLPQIWPVDKSSIRATHDSQNNIYFFQHEAHNTQISDCKGTKHRFKVLAIHGETGMQIWQREFIANDFCYPADIKMSPLGELFVIGGYADNIQFDEFVLGSDSCKQNNRFLLQIDKKGQVIQAKKINRPGSKLNQLKFTQNGDFYIVGSELKQSYFGVIGGIDTSYFSYPLLHSSIFIDRYNKVAEHVHEYTFHQNSYYFQTVLDDFNPRISFDDKGIILACQTERLLDTFNISGYNIARKKVFLIHFPKTFNPPNTHITFDQNSFSISPNPTTEFLHIQSNHIDFTEAHITIFAIDGKQWQLPKEKNHGFVNIQTKALPQGVYTVVVRIGDKMLAQKFIKM